MLTGRVDNFANSHLTGWAFNKEAPGEHVIIRVNYGTQIVATGVANILRPDLPKSGIGAGDHAFRIELPANITSVNGLMVIAQSQKHGEIALPIATNDERTLDALFNSFTKRYDNTLGLFKQEIDDIKEKLEDRGSGAEPNGIRDLPDDLAQRLIKLENRMESAEVFFVRIDQMMRQLVDEKKKRRKRFLGIF
ncbi:MAG: hypothetical protein JWL86_5093 [Rhizobium sp.]|nr:hypothetical protein [Rhizobium sp.]